ncbi:MAG: hypothetical protein JNM22_05435 [Saprospiraceae bacterium]|nr:hypothetical protein [Saprospiraceae bacterium]
MTNILEYVEDLEKGKSTAERLYKQRKAIWDRATSAYGKAQLFESTWKDFYDGSEATSKLAMSIYDAMFRAVKYGDGVASRTADANKAVELLAYDVRDIACQAEYLQTLVDEFNTSAKVALGKDSKCEKFVADFMKTLPDVSKFAIDALDKTLELVKTTDSVHEAISGNCGINARILDVMSTIKAVGLLHQLDPNSETAKQTANLRKKYTSQITEVDDLKDDTCDTAYKAFKGQKGATCANKENDKFDQYVNWSKNNLGKAENKLTLAREWLNCTTEAKNKAEAAFNACKAAYELALEAKKC